MVSAGNVDQLLGILMPQFNEKLRRIFLAAFSGYLGRGGTTLLSEKTGVSRVTINNGKTELKSLPCDPKARPAAESASPVRAKGGGRKSTKVKQPGIENALLGLLEGNTVGNPENPLCWTTKSLRNLADELKKQGHSISYVTVGNLLETLGFSLQQNRKYVEAGNPSPDRDAQFRFISEESKMFMAANQPVISVDTKKKELVGNFKNGGAEYSPKGQAVKVQDHDFGDSKACPYGIYEVNANEGFVSVGMSADTGAFAVNSIRTWWEEMGRERYPEASRLMITADGGGSNGRRNRLWKTSLQKFANETGLEVHISHFPPGTSKWNKIEHRMFAYISKNWRGRPLETYEIIVNLIANTTTTKGLTIKCQLDKREYEKGIKVSDEEMAQLNLTQKEWHGEWNYVISPQTSSCVCKI